MKIMEFEHMGHIFGALEVSPPMLKCWPSQKKMPITKWLYLLDYHMFFSSENSVGICGMHLPHMDASQMLVGLEGANILFVHTVYFLWT